MPNQLVQPPMKRLQLSGQDGTPSEPGLKFLQRITDALNGTTGVVAPNVSQITLGTGINHFSGVGSPQGVVTANVGDQYMNTSGGAATTLYIKTSGNGTNTGWTAK